MKAGVINQKCSLAQFLIQAASGHLGEPVVDGRKERKDIAAEHGVVEMTDDKVGVVQVQVGRDGGVGRSGEAAQQERRRYQPARRAWAFRRKSSLSRACRHPGEELNPGRHGHQQGAVHERHAQVFGHAGGEHVMRPHQETNQGDRQG